jgi:hypothetical protein
MPSHYVFRLRGLPLNATPSDFDVLVQHLNLGEKLEFVDEIREIVPNCPHGDSLTGIIGVNKPLPEFLSQLVTGRATTVVFNLRGEDVSIDAHFDGFTQLYPTRPTKHIRAE